MLPREMNVIEISNPGGPEVLEMGRRNLPEPGPGALLIKVHTAGVNGPDMMQRKGLYPPPKGASDVLGLEVAGEVAAKGDGVGSWQVDDAVCALVNGGGYAEYVTVPAAQALPVPKSVSMQDAGGLCETFFTVWSNAFFPKRPEPGATLLVHGGAGGIGGAAIQLGRVFGLKVFATCGSDEKCRYAESLGAVRAINYRTEDFVEVLQAEGGADVILDIVGGDYIARNLKVAKMDGRIVQLAFRDGAKVEVNLMPIMLKRLTLTGSTLRPRPAAFKAAIADDLKRHVWPLFAQGKLQVQTHKVFDFVDVTAAHTMMEQAGHQGKILLRW